MYTELSLAAAWLGLAASDAIYSARQIRKYGPQVELNGAIKWLVGKFGPTLGTYLGVGIPALAFVPLAKLPVLMALLVGARAALAAAQYQRWKMGL